MSSSRAEQIAVLAPRDRRRYWMYRTAAILSGVVSLFSFWIMVLINSIIPWGGASYSLGRDARLMDWAPFGLILAIAAFVTSLGLKGRAKTVRNTYQPRASSSEDK